MFKKDEKDFIDLEVKGVNLFNFQGEDYKKVRAENIKILHQR